MGGHMGSWGSGYPRDTWAPVDGRTGGRVGGLIQVCPPPLGASAFEVVDVKTANVLAWKPHDAEQVFGMFWAPPP